MISLLIQRIRAGGLSAIAARRQLLDIIALAISFGLDTDGMIIQALTEAKLVFELHYASSFDLSLILGISVPPIPMNPVDGRLLFLTCSEVTTILEKELSVGSDAPDLAASDSERDLLQRDAVLNQSNFPNEFSPLKQTSMRIQKFALDPEILSKKRHRVNYVEDGETAAKLYASYFLTGDRKKKLFH
jgi:hypothetical protein